MEHFSSGSTVRQAMGVRRLTQKLLAYVGGELRRYMRSSRLAITKETRAFVLDRDRSTCQMCGAASGEPHHDDARHETRIQIGRILAKSLGGGDDASNLRTICSICNQGLRDLILDRPPLRKLLIQLRRATGGDQLEVLKWLITKYPVQAAKIIGKMEK